MKSVIKIKSDLSEIEKVLDALEKSASDNSVSEGDIYQIRLCLDELLTNTINYGFPDGAEHPIEIVHSISGEGLTIQIIDEGVEFNPLEKEEPDLDADLDEREIGGLGIFLVKNYMDDLNYERSENKNILTLTKKFDKNNGD